MEQRTGSVESVERMREFDTAFYRGKKVLITGHTGFKGTWLCRMLLMAGAEVTGFSRGSLKSPDFFALSGAKENIRHITGDIRDLDALMKAFDAAKPEIVFHLAAQPIVRAGYSDPVGTYSTNVMGTVNVLECLRLHDYTHSFVNVTTDKVYKNVERLKGYREEEELNGYDPYSNSKSCSELVTSSYVNSFLSGRMAVSTARAGNVIGGGDFAADRIIPDCVRAAVAGEVIILRNPNSTRPYQHVLEPVYAYMMIAARQYETPSLAGSYNVGPDDTDHITTRNLAELFVKHWGEGLSYTCPGSSGPHEAALLSLDCTKLKNIFGWSPRWDAEKAVEMTVEWSKCWRDGGDICTCMDRQIDVFLKS